MDDLYWRYITVSLNLRCLLFQTVDLSLFLCQGMTIDWVVPFVDQQLLVMVIDAAADDEIFAVLLERVCA